MLFSRVSLLVYVSVAVSTTFALPTPHLPDDSTSNLSHDTTSHAIAKTRVSHSVALVSRWLDDIDITNSRRQILTNIGDLVNITYLSPLPTPPTPPQGSAPDAGNNPDAGVGVNPDAIPIVQVCDSNDEDTCDDLRSEACADNPECFIDVPIEGRALPGPEVQTPPEVQTSSKVKTPREARTSPNVRKLLEPREPPKLRGPPNVREPLKIRTPPGLAALD